MNPFIMQDVQNVTPETLSSVNEECLLVDHEIKSTVKHLKTMPNFTDEFKYWIVEIEQRKDKKDYKEGIQMLISCMTKVRTRVLENCLIVTDIIENNAKLSESEQVLYISRCFLNSGQVIGADYACLTRLLEYVVRKSGFYTKANAKDKFAYVFHSIIERMVDVVPYEKYVELFALTVRDDIKNHIRDRLRMMDGSCYALLDILTDIHRNLNGQEKKELESIIEEKLKKNSSLAELVKAFKFTYPKEVVDIMDEIIQSRIDLLKDEKPKHFKRFLLNPLLSNLVLNGEEWKRIRYFREMTEECLVKSNYDSEFVEHACDIIDRHIDSLKKKFVTTVNEEKDLKEDIKWLRQLKTQLRKQDAGWTRFLALLKMFLGLQK
jgi:FtsZ-binding cell division protein ZapB